VSNSKGLGRGFDVLMPSGVDSSLLEQDKNRVQKLFVSSISPNKDQPRKHFDQAALEQLSESIKQHGILQPLIVTPSGGGTYRIIAGERRWRAARLAGVEHVPAIVRSSEELEELEIALVENIQRVDLSPLEQAVSIQRLHDQFSQNYESIAKRLGKAESTVVNIVRLLQLSPAAQQALREERITEGHARALLALRDYPQQQAELLILIQKNLWSVRQAEQFVTATKKGGETETAVRSTASETPETETISQVLKAPVSIKRMAKGGRLIISFKTDRDLQRLYTLLQKLG
jgi:ParB family chromosome partitioning protein